MNSATLDALHQESKEYQKDEAIAVKGYNFDAGIPSISTLMQSYATSGFQSLALAQACKEINRMLEWRLSDETSPESFEDDDFKDPIVRQNTTTYIWLSFTSNMISCGLRETLLFLAKHKLINCINTTAGGIEEDFIKCLAPSLLGSWETSDTSCRENGWNRIGNLIVPNKNYCLFEDWVQPILDECLDEQISKGVTWTPSKIIAKLGEKINNEDSLFYWCWKNDIPVFCPALTDGALGDNIYFHTYRRRGLVVDLVEDIRRINDIASFLGPRKSGMIILGGGVPKHHTCNANLMRNGADFAVYVNTGQAFDGSDSGATPSEAISWGKIKQNATPVKVCAEASVVFPLIVAETFAKKFYQQQK